MDPVLTVSGLCKRYPGFSLENVSFSLEKGHIMGFLGRNGAGKTTTMKMLLGLTKPPRACSRGWRQRAYSGTEH